MKALFVAVDGGPREALAPIAARYDSALADTAMDAAETVACWSGIIASQRPDVVVAGTSDSERGRRTEGAARRAARSAQLPVVAIEDFPGSYDTVAGGEASLVLVESAAARALLLEKLGGRSPDVEVATPARYDPYRTNLARLRRQTRERWAAQERPSVLWAGQPETDDAVHTLHALLPVLRQHDVELLFKAHPRDTGYAAGAYGALLDASGVSVSDLTNATAEAALGTAPRLVVTQFSSIAIEGGFFGVPSLWILLAHAGGARLLQKKGYAVPPLCLAQGAAYAGDESSLSGAFGRALDATDYRENLMRCFDDYFKVHEAGAARVAALLLAVANRK